MAHSIVLAISGNEILTCKSMKQLADLNLSVQVSAADAANLDLNAGNVSIRDFQRISQIDDPANPGVKRSVVSGDKPIVMPVFLRRLNYLRNANLGYGNIFIKKEPEFKQAGAAGAGGQQPDRITCLFVYSTNPNAEGFIKGGIEAGHTARFTAQKEFEEETGTNYPEANFIPVLQSGNSNVFQLNIPAADKPQIISNWQARRADIREITDLRWQPIQTVIQNQGQLNPQSQPAIPALRQIGNPPAPAAPFAPGAGQPQPAAPAVANPNNFPPPLPGGETLAAYITRVAGNNGILRIAARRYGSQAFGLAGGRKTIRRKKSKRSKRKGTLKREVRR